MKSIVFHLVILSGCVSFSFAAEQPDAYNQAQEALEQFHKACSSGIVEEIAKACESVEQARQHFGWWSRIVGAPDENKQKIQKDLFDQDEQALKAAQGVITHCKGRDCVSAFRRLARLYNRTDLAYQCSQRSPHLFLANKSALEAFFELRRKLASQNIEIQLDEQALVLRAIDQHDDKSVEYLLGQRNNLVDSPRLLEDAVRKADRATGLHHESTEREKSMKVLELVEAVMRTRNIRHDDVFYSYARNPCPYAWGGVMHWFISKGYDINRVDGRDQTALDALVEGVGARVLKGVNRTTMEKREAFEELLDKGGTFNNLAQARKNMEKAIERDCSNKDKDSSECVNAQTMLAFIKAIEQEQNKNSGKNIKLTQAVRPASGNSR